MNLQHYKTTFIINLSLKNAIYFDILFIYFLLRVQNIFNKLFLYFTLISSVKQYQNFSKFYILTEPIDDFKCCRFEKNPFLIISYKINWVAKKFHVYSICRYVFLLVSTAKSHKFLCRMRIRRNF